MNYFNNKYLKDKNNKGFTPLEVNNTLLGNKLGKPLTGFTLIELIIVMALFLLITGASLGIFISVIKSQRMILAEQQFLNQISYVNEYMSKALRMAKTAENDACLPEEGYIYELTGRDPVSGLFEGIRFLASDGVTCQQFFWDTDGSLKEKRGDDPAVAITSTNDFEINSVKFSINGSDGSAGFCSNKDQCGAAFTDIVQPRVTILFNVTINNESPKTIQTTISQRNLNVDYGQRYESIPPSIFPSGWQYYRKITIAPKVADTLENFPVLVKLIGGIGGNFDFTKSSGYDIRFATKNGENLSLLKYQMVSYDGANSFAEFWVRIPYISNSAPTEIYIYYGNDTATDTSTMAAVWDSSYKGVWHENNATVTDTISDSTYYGNNGDKSDNTSTEVDGKIGKAQSFNGVDNYITIPDKYSLEIGGPFTLSGWVGLPATLKPADNFFFGKWQDFSDNRSYGMWYWVGSWEKLTLGVSDDGTWKSNDWNKLEGARLSANNWYYVTGVFDGTKRMLYVNGVLSAETSVAGSTFIDTNESNFMMGAILGSTGAVSNYFKGILDEVRISDTARSASWIGGEYFYGGGDNTSVAIGDETEL